MIICGNVLEVLGGMKSESVDCSITSPPYWSLRTYEGTEVVWGGAPNCQHKWVEHIDPKRRGSTNADSSFNVPARKEMGKLQNIKTDFCSKCGAWRGQLGLEPTFNLFVSHMLQITGELKRVLKKTGTMWLNLGDTYMGGIGYSDRKRYDELHPNGIDSDARFFDRPSKNLNRLDPKIYDSLSGRIRKKKTLEQRQEYAGGRIDIDDYYEGRAMRGRGLDKYQAKCLCLIPERLAIALVEQGWLLRSKIIWHKTNSMPSSVTDRLSNTWEYVYLFTKAKRYYFNLDAIRVPLAAVSIQRAQYGWNATKQKKAGLEGTMYQGLTQAKLEKWRQKHIMPNYYGSPQARVAEGRVPIQLHPLGKNPGDMWSISTSPFPDLHFATFPESLCVKPILAGSPPHGIVLDPFSGSGTTGVVAAKLGRKFIGIELNKSYCEMAQKRIAPYEQQAKLF